MTDQELRITVSAKDSASSVLKKIQGQVGDSSSAISKGLSQATRSAENMGGGLDLSAKKAAIMGAVAGATVAGLTALARGLKSVGEAAIGGAADYEQQRIAFETMLGSADKARGMMEQIAQFAKSTPFELPEVVKGSKQLLAFGVAQEQIIPTMRMLGDIAAGVGVPVGQLAYVFGQVRVAGKLMGGDLMQFTNAGVPMIEGLSKVLKVSQGDVKKMVEAGEVGFDKVQKVLENMTGAGSKFGGMMDKQSKSFSGVVSNIKDGFGQMLRSAVGVTAGGDIVANGLFERIKKAAEKAMPAVQRASEAAGPAVQRLMERLDDLARSVIGVGRQVWDYLAPKMEALANTVKDKLLPVLWEFWKTYLEPLMPVIGEVLVASLGFAIDALNVLVTAFASVTDWINNNTPVFLGLATTFGIIAAAMVFNHIVNAMIVQFNILKLVEIPSLITTWQLMAATLATPIVAAIAVGGAVAALSWLYNETEKTRKAVELAIGTFQKAADIAPAVTQTKAFGGQGTKGITILGGAGLSQLSISGRASGGSAAPGTSYVVGEKQAEVYTPNTRGRIQPSLRDSGGGGVINNIYGAITINSADAANAFFDRLDKTQRLARMGMA